MDSEVAGGSEDSQQIKPKSKTQLSRTERPVSVQPPGLLTEEIGKDILFRCESTNSRTVRPVNASSFSQSCVPVSVERVDKDKDADENVDADQTRMGRPVSGQPIGLFTQLEEIDVDFRVSGLPHAVVKQAENFRVRELMNKDGQGDGVPKAGLQQAAADSRGSRTCVCKHPTRAGGTAGGEG